MLPPYIIEEIRKREEERIGQQRWPRIELPLERPEDDPPWPVPEEDEEGRSSVVDYTV